MPKRYVIPAFDATDSESRTETTIKIEGASGRKLILVRCTGTVNVRLHNDIPVDAADELNGFPLGANATDAELGECLPQDLMSAADGALYVTATAESEIAVLTKA